MSTKPSQTATEAPPAEASAPAKGGRPDTSGWQEQPIGFVPYWEPKVGDSIYCMPLALDARQMGFHRFVCEAKETIPCFIGSTDTQKAVNVAEGEAFSISRFASLPLADYIGLPILIRVDKKEKMPPMNGEPRSRWVFSILVSADVKRKMAARNYLKANRTPAALPAGTTTVVDDSEIPF